MSSDILRPLSVLRLGSVLALGAATVACGDRCLVYEYAPPSVRLTLRDTATGQPICSAADYIVSTNRGSAIAHEDTCEWWLPAWAPSGDAGALATESELVVSVTGYRPLMLNIAIERNECGEVQAPLPVGLDLEPGPAK